jgi:hypothetical protein
MSIIDPPAVKTASGYRLAGVGPLLEGGGEGGDFDPKELQEAYKIPATGGSTQTVAIVDAYDDPNAEADLQKYREKYKVYYKGTETACTKANGCFKKVNQEGKEEKYPSDKYPRIGETNKVEDWGFEISIDLDMVSAICPECKIVLVEANEPSTLLVAEEEAEKLEVGGKKLATEISNSWGSNEFAGETEDDKYFEHAGIPITFSSGDSGYKLEYPAASKYVIAVGGTTLKKAAKTERGWEETVWAGTGSGCSAYESKPSWQTDSGCSKRTDNDVAAVANPGSETEPGSPVSVYDSYEYEEAGYGTGKLGWVGAGGTSVAAPLIAGIEAHAETAAKSLGAEVFYGQPKAEFDVTSGSNGTCKTYLCEAGVGYDGPTGMGSPNGVPKILPIAEGTSPAAIEPGSNDPSIFYVDSNHEIAYWSYTTTGGWTNGVIGGSVESGTSPAASYQSGSGLSIIYFVNKSGEIATWTRLTGAWAETTLGGKVESGTSPAAFLASSSELHVVYVNSSKEIAEWRYPGGPSWTDTALGGSVESGTSPAADYQSGSGLSIIYFVNKSGEIATWTRLTGAWAETTLGGSVESGTSPAAFIGSELHVIYVNKSGGEIAEWRYPGGSSWVNSIL